jgi:PadR family transcriptional regulator PadR
VPHPLPTQPGAPELLQGTLDMLILKALSVGPMHGYGILLRIQHFSGAALEILQGSLYPAVYRLEHQGLLSSEWGTSDNNRRAKFYSLTPAGRRRLKEERESWSRLVQAITAVMNATPADLAP